MPDAIFSHPRLAAVYDAFDGDRTDLDAYVALAAELRARTVLDVGCGTGSLALRLAELGYRVVGVDPAEASLDVARAKPGADAVTWIVGDATALPAAGADLAVMAGNVAQVFLSDEDWEGTLRAIAAALRPGGYLVFETRRPERKAWEDWAAETEPVVLEVPEVGTVARSIEVLSVDPPYVTFRQSTHFLTEDTILDSDSTLRFREREELEESLTRCGFRVTDVREAPDRPGREFVVVGERVG